MLDIIYTLLFYPLIKWTLISIAISYAFYRYYSSKCTHWETQGIQTVSVGLLTRFIKPWHIWEQELYVKYGKLFGIYELNRPVLYLSDPDTIRDVLVKDFHSFTNRRKINTGSDPIMDNMVVALRDDNWKRVRTVMSPTFTTGKLKQMLPLIDDCLQNMLKNLATVSQSESGVGDMKRLFGAYTMEAVIQVAFGTRVDALYDEDNPIIVNARSLLSRNIHPKFFVIILAPKLAKLMRLSFFDQNVMKFFSQLTLKIIDDRKRQLNSSSNSNTNDNSSQKRVDFLQLMLDSMANSGSNSSSSSDVGAGDADDLISNNNNNNSKEKYQEFSTNSTETFEKYLTNDEFIAQCVLFFIAGYETTANTLSLTIYLLAKHPKVQDRLRTEVDQYFQQHTDGVVDYDVLHSLKYLDAVIQETLRLYPAALFLEREANTDYKLTIKDTSVGGGIDGSVTIKQGQLVHMPIYAMHRDPANFVDPLEYRPERFLPDNIAHHPYAYVPFGAGPRNCIGMRLAQMEAKLALANAIHSYRFHDTGKPLEFFNNPSSMSPKSISIRVEKLV